MGFPGCGTFVSKCRNLLAHPYFPGEPEQRAEEPQYLRDHVALSCPMTLSEVSW